MSKGKYGSRKVKKDGMTFDSIREYNRWRELKLLERSGKIEDLKRQVPFTLIPVQKDEEGKVIEKACKYYADFTYMEKEKVKDGAPEFVVEDTKGFRTTEYIIKRKLMLKEHGIRIREV